MTLIVLYVVLCGVSFVVYGDDNTINIRTTRAGNITYEKYLNLTKNEREEYFKEIHGGIKEYNEHFFGLVVVYHYNDGSTFGGYEVNEFKEGNWNANEFVDYDGENGDGIDFLKLFKDIGDILFLNIELVNQLGSFQWFVRFPIWAGMLYCFTDIIWFG